MSHINKNRGSTLIEIVIALVIITISALGGIALYFNSNELKSVAVHKKMAVELASNLLEEVRHSSYSSVVDVATTPVTSAESTGLNSIGADKTVDVTEAGGYKTVEIDIDWNESGQIKRPFNVQMITYKMP